MTSPLAGDVEIPKFGKIPKKILVPVVAGAAGYVAWRFWKQRQSATDAAASPIVDGEFGAVDTSIPGTLNPFPGSFSGGGGGGGTSTGSGSGVTGDTNGDGTIGPGEFTTNGQWTAYVTDRIPTDTWTSTDIITALGLGLGGKPTTDEQQKILRAATAIGGQPPQGAITYVTGGNTDLTVAPGWITVDAQETSATVNFGSTPGATSYQVFRDGVPGAIGAGSGSPIQIGGLTPNTGYTVWVSGVTASGKVGPRSAVSGFKTKAFDMPRPATPSITAITATSATASIPGVANADEYIWYLNGGQRALTEGTSYPFTGLKPKTKYSVSVTARGFHQYASGMSGAATFTTK